MKYYKSLVIYRKQLGDVLLLQPALEALAMTGPVAVATNAAFADLLALMPGPIDLAPRCLPRAKEIYCLETRGRSVAYAAQGFGARKVLVLTRDNASWWKSLVFDEMRVIPGEGTYRAKLFHSALSMQPHVFRKPALKPPPPDWQADGLPARYGVVHPTSAWQRKTWSPDRWIEALRGISDTLCWVISSGNTPWEVQLAGEVAAGLGNQALNFAGKTTLRQYLSLLSRSRITLCVDGSASHISAAFGVPTLTLFGPTNPVHWHNETPATPRLWAGDYVNEDKPPVDSIPIAVVREAASKLLERSHA